MKTVLLSLFASALPLFSQAKFQGDYLGIALPVGNCSNERRTINLIAEPDGRFHATLFDWDANSTNYFVGDMTPAGKATCLTGWDLDDPNWNPLDPNSGWPVKLSFSASAGTCKGTIDGRADGFCKYTFTLYRRFKVAQ